MELNPNVWYVRLFFWSFEIWSAFLEGDYARDRSHMEKNGTNLCFFIRVMVVYMPLVLLLHLGLVVVAVISLTALPIYLFGGIAYGWILATTAMVVGIIWGVKTMRQHRLRRARDMASLIDYVEVEEEPVASQVDTALKGPGFFEVVWAYIVAAKKQVCPSINFLPTKEVRR